MADFNLSEWSVPVRVRFTVGKGTYATIAVFQYTDGKILTASAIILDPANWAEVLWVRPLNGSIKSPPWVGRTNKELSQFFRDRGGMGLGEFVDDLRGTVASDNERFRAEIRAEAEKAPPKKPIVPLSVTTVREEEEVDADAPTSG